MKDVGISKEIYLSPSKLDLFNECQLCFWLQEKHGIKRPGTFPTLPQGMDVKIKKYFDEYRRKDVLPPELSNEVQGKLVKQDLINEWRSNGKRTRPFYEDKNLKAVLYGALDECLVIQENGEEKYIPVDFKTRGYDFKENAGEKSSQENYDDFYQLQLDAYTLMLEGSGYKTKRKAYLIYYIPEEVKEGAIVKFKVRVSRIETNPDNAREVFEKAVKLLKGDLPPHPAPQCKYCEYFKKRGGQIK